MELLRLPAHIASEKVLSCGYACEVVLVLAIGVRSEQINSLAHTNHFLNAHQSLYLGSFEAHI